MAAFRVESRRRNGVKTRTDCLEALLHGGIAKNGQTFALICAERQNRFPAVGHDDEISVVIVVRQAEHCPRHLSVIHPPEDAADVVTRKDRDREQEPLAVGIVHYRVAACGKRQMQEILPIQRCAQPVCPVRREEARGVALRFAVELVENRLPVRRVRSDIVRRVAQLRKLGAELLLGDERHVHRLPRDDVLHRQIQKARDFVLHEDRAKSQSENQYEELGGNLQERVAPPAVFNRQGTPPPPRTSPSDKSAYRPGQLPRCLPAGRPCCPGSGPGKSDGGGFRFHVAD